MANAVMPEKPIGITLGDGEFLVNIIGNDYYYDSAEEFDGLWSAFETAWNECNTVAHLIQQCMEYEQLAAVYKGMVEGAMEAYSYAASNLNNAILCTNDYNIDTNITQMNLKIEKLSSYMLSTTSDEMMKSLCDTFDATNKSLGSCGEALTDAHNTKYYVNYKTAADAVHEPIQEFI